MPIIIPREGPIPSAPTALTQEQQEKLWEHIFENWAQNNPDKLLEIVNGERNRDQITTE